MMLMMMINSALEQQLKQSKKTADTHPGSLQTPPLFVKGCRALQSCRGRGAGGRRWRDKGGQMRTRRAQKKCDKGRGSRRDAVGDRDRFMRKMLLKSRSGGGLRSLWVSFRVRGVATPSRVKDGTAISTTKQSHFLFSFFFWHQQWIQKEVAKISKSAAAGVTAAAACGVAQANFREKNAQHNTAATSAVRKF